MNHTKLWKGVAMKTVEGINITCVNTGKVCYTEREAGVVINNCRKHVHAGSHRWIKADHSNSKNIPRRKCYCKDCGYYHVTHKALYDFDSHNGLWEEDFYREYGTRKRA